MKSILDHCKGLSMARSYVNPESKPLNAAKTNQNWQTRQKNVENKN